MMTAKQTWMMGNYQVILVCRHFVWNGEVVRVIDVGLNNNIISTI
jgi:hypothetical protein